MEVTCLLVAHQCTLCFPCGARRSRADFFQERSSSGAPAHPTRNVDTTFVPDLEAEVGRVIFLQDATAHAPYAQRITDDRRATCRRSSEAQCGPPQLQMGTQLHNFVVGHRGYDVSSGVRGLYVVRAALRAAHD